jgi:RNA polymerase sigma-70 factor (ECF subfamily)
LDRDLVARAQRGDEVAFGELVELVGDRLYAVAHHVLRDHGRADDAVQQAMIDLWRKLPTLNDPDRFLPWAYRIVVRAALAEAADRRRWITRVTLAGGAGVAQSTPDHQRAFADRDELDRALDALAVDHRTVVVLKHYAGLSNQEISEILAVPEGTVRSRLHYGMSSLRAAFEAGRRLAAAAEP